MASLDDQATVLRTNRGDVQLAHEGRGRRCWCVTAHPGDSISASHGAATSVRPAAGSLHPDRGTSERRCLPVAARRARPICTLRCSTCSASIGSPTASPQWKPERMASYAVDGMSEGLTRDQRKAASDWIRSDPGRLRMIKDLSSAIAPRRHRAAGWANDEANEAGLAPLPFEAVTSPTLIAQGRNDSVVPSPEPKSCSWKRGTTRCRCAGTSVPSPIGSWN